MTNQPSTPTPPQGVGHPAALSIFAILMILLGAGGHLLVAVKLMVGASLDAGCWPVVGGYALLANAGLTGLSGLLARRETLPWRRAVSLAACWGAAAGPVLVVGIISDPMGDIPAVYMGLFLAFAFVNTVAAIVHRSWRVLGLTSLVVYGSCIAAFAVLMLLSIAWLIILYVRELLSGKPTGAFVD